QRAGLDRAEAEGDPRGPAVADEHEQLGKPVEPEDIDAAPGDAHARGERDAGDEHERDRRAREADERVAEHDPAPVPGGGHESPREAALEVEREREAREEAGEHRRLAEDEDELERGVAGGEVKSGDRAERGEPAGEAGEEHEREDQGRDEQVGPAHVRVQAAPRDRERDPPDAAAARAHVRWSLVRSAPTAAASEIAVSAAATAKPRHSAVPSQP